MKPRSKLVTRTVIIISGSIIIMTLSGCSNPLAKVNNTTTVATQSVTTAGAISFTVKPDKMDTEISGTGLIIPAKTTSLYYNNLSGTLKKLFIKENDQVKVGQPIIEIQAKDILNRMSDQQTIMKRWDIRINQLDEDINSSQASMKLANINLANAKGDAKSSSSYINQLKLQYDISRSAYKQAIWNRELAGIDYYKDKKTLDDLKALVNQVVLKSPINGVAINVENLSDNDMVSSGFVVARIAEFKNMVFKLNTADSEHISSFTKAVLTINKKNYEVSVYTPQPGDQLGSSINSQSNKNYIYLKFNSTIPSINTNELVEASLNISKNQALVLPKEAVYQEAGKNLVDIQYGKDTKTIEVTEGLESDDKIEIISGLKPGDKVIMR